MKNSGVKTMLIVLHKRENGVPQYKPLNRHNNNNKAYEVEERVENVLVLHREGPTVNIFLGVVALVAGSHARTQIRKESKLGEVNLNEPNNKVAQDIIELVQKIEDEVVGKMLQKILYAAVPAHCSPKNWGKYAINFQSKVHPN